jgi:FKBP-type peptidyl-prolyl cis-trans isomerase FkpA
MSKIKFYFIVLIAAIAISSCNKDNNDIEVVPPRDYVAQYATESALIDTYLKTSYITIVEAPGLPQDQNVTITAIPPGGAQTPIWDYALNAGTTTFPQLLFRTVNLDGVAYKLYYLVLRQGTGEKPCNVDSVFTSYSGKYITETTTNNVTSITSTLFEESLFPQAYINLFNTIRGWKEVFPQFRTGDTSSNDDGTVKYTNFGAGVMFIPSGLAYYNTGNLPAYSTLVFSFKLYQTQRIDFEPDGVMSFQEDIDGDGYVWTNSELQLADGKTNPDDTDKDGTPDFLDFDDDGDNYATRGEVKDANGDYYPYGALVDDPLTTIDERIGIPRKYTGELTNPNLPESETNPRKSQPSDFTDPTRLRRHLDPTCHFMNQ